MVGQIEAYMEGERARGVYRRREIEYPVDYIMNVSVRRAQAGSGYVAKEIADWAERKFGVEMPLEEVQEISYDKFRQRLLELSEEYNNGALRREVEAAVGECGWGLADKMKLCQWAYKRFEMSLEAEELNEENAREIIESGGREFLRSELTELERYVLLQIYDSTWKDHLYAMDHLKSSVGLRGYAERDPRLEYKREGFRMFQQMLSSIRDKVTDIIFKAQLDSRESMRSVWNISATSHAEYERFQAQQEAAQAPDQKPKTIKLEKPKVGRNAPCPCGSGKKYKKCCGKNVT